MCVSFFFLTKNFCNVFQKYSPFTLNILNIPIAHPYFTLYLKLSHIVSSIGPSVIFQIVKNMQFVNLFLAFFVTTLKVVAQNSYK